MQAVGHLAAGIKVPPSLLAFSLMPMSLAHKGRDVGQRFPLGRDQHSAVLPHAHLSRFGRDAFQILDQDLVLLRKTLIGDLGVAGERQSRS